MCPLPYPRQTSLIDHSTRHAQLAEHILGLKAAATKKLHQAEGGDVFATFYSEQCAEITPSEAADPGVWGSQTVRAT